MVKRSWIGILIVLSMFVFATGCDLIKKKDTDPADSFKRGPSGLLMEFVPNYPGDKYIVSEATEAISIVIDIRNKGTYPPSTAPENGQFPRGKIYLSGFDDRIINMNVEGLTEENILKEGKTKALSEMFLPAASPINPLGSIDTAQFDGKIIGDNIRIDRYEPTILVTACYPYITKASPNVCIDPSPFDSTEEKVCSIGSQKLSTQGAPVAVTKIDQEAATNKIQFKITIKNVGDGDVLKSGTSEDKDGNEVEVLDKCSPLGGGKLDRKDFDKVKVIGITVGDVALWSDEKADNKCGPFADGTQDIIRLFGGEGFVICTLDITDLGDVQSAYTTPISINLNYTYRSTISKGISITKLTAIS